MSSNRYLDLLIQALDRGGELKIPTPSVSDARRLRWGLYKARQFFRKRLSVTGESPFDRFVIGMKDSTVFINTEPTVLEPISPQDFALLDLEPGDFAPQPRTAGKAARPPDD